MLEASGIGRPREFNPSIAAIIDGILIVKVNSGKGLH